MGVGVGSGETECNAGRSSDFPEGVFEKSR